MVGVRGAHHVELVAVRDGHHLLASLRRNASACMAVCGSRIVPGGRTIPGAHICLGVVHVPPHPRLRRSDRCPPGRPAVTTRLRELPGRRGRAPRHHRRLCFGEGAVGWMGGTLGGGQEPARVCVTDQRLALDRDFGELIDRTEPCATPLCLSLCRPLGAGCPLRRLSLGSQQSRDADSVAGLACKTAFVPNNRRPAAGGSEREGCL